MPTYDYECQKCRHKFEAFQSITAATLKKCPECGKHSLRRLIGAGAGIIFRGSGFYITDYKQGSSAGAKAAGKSSPGKASGGTDSSTGSDPSS
jgi:putative FmdB family regulatory protein